jgi:hypothetical protein
VERFEVAIDNLIRLGCSALFREVYLSWAEGKHKSTNYEEISITPFGVAFVEACIEGKKRKKIIVSLVNDAK